MKDLMKDLFSNWKTVPNLLSFLRILMVPLIAVFYTKGYVLFAVITVALSGLTDLFDGKIARRFNQVSNLGKILDPIADKLTVITIAILLYLKFKASPDETIKAFSWVFLVFLGKDAFMVVGGAVMIALGIRPGAAEIFGKISTCVFYGVMVLIIAFGNTVGALTQVWTMPSKLAGILVVVAAFATVLAFLSYVPGIIRQAKIRFNKDYKGEIVD